MKENSGKNRLITFFTQERKKLAGFAGSYLAGVSELDGDDIVQEVFVTLLGRSDDLVPEEGLSAYVYRSLKNRVTDFFRKKRSITVSGTEDGFDILDIVGDESSDLEILYELSEQHTIFYEALETLDPLEQKLIIETEFESKPYSKLTEETGVALGTLLSKKSRALKKLKKILNEKEINYAL